MIGTPEPWSVFATRTPPLVGVDNFSVYPRCMPIALAVADFSCNLILRSEVMSMQWGYASREKTAGRKLKGTRRKLWTEILL